MPDNQADLKAMKNQAIDCLRRHELPEAARHIEAVCRKDNGDADAWEILASIYNQLGDIDKVVYACKQIVGLQPQTAQTQFNLALALDISGKQSDAIVHYRQALNIEPNHGEAQYNLGLALQETGAPGDAIAHYRNALGIRPHWPEAYNNLALALRQTGDLKGAIDLLEEAVAANPSHLKHHHALGETFEEDCQLERANQIYRKALDLDPRNAGTLLHIGGVLVNQGKFDEALAQYRKALQLLPDDPDIQLGLIDVYDSMGAYEQALEQLLPLLEKHPDNVKAALRFASLCKHTSQCDEAVTLLENLVRHDKLLPESVRKIHYALGKLYDSDGNYEQAFRNFRQGNNLKNFIYDIQRYSNLVKILISAFSKEKFSKMPNAVTRQSNPQPVFIVGMPRSGTSLTEQIIATHSQVFGAGELDIIPRLVANMAGELGSKDLYPHCIPLLTQEKLTAFSKHYIAHIDNLYTEIPRVVTDKMPENFLHLGLIELLFPQARVIHCVRDPMDTCLSCYMQEFRGTHHYAYDLRNLGAYYYQYRKIMTHWNQVLQLPVLEIRYEDLVTDTESTCRGIFDFLGLDWEEQCLLFYKSGRFVNTVSQEQVKQPIYTRSVGRWKHYQDYLQPLKAALEKGV